MFRFRAVSVVLVLMSSALLGVPAVEAAPAPYQVAGGCLYLDDNSKYSYGTKISCAKVHSFEVMWIIKNLPDTWPPPSQSFKNPQVSAFLADNCSPDAVHEKLGKKPSWPALERITAVTLLPQDFEWKAGARWALCVAGRQAWTARGDEYVQFKGKLAPALAKGNLTPYITCKSDVDESGWSRRMMCDNKNAYWLQITNPTPTTGTAAGDCEAVARALSKPERPLEYLWSAESKPVSEMETCFIPYANWVGAKVASKSNASAPKAYAKAGQCVDVEEFSGARGKIVACSKPHNFEVTKVLEDLPEAWPVPSRMTGSIRDEVFLYVDGACRARALRSQYYRSPDLPDFGNLSFQWEFPSDKEWRAGARWALCIVKLAKYDGPDREIWFYDWSGSIASLAMSNPIRLILCRKGDAVGAGGVPVNCTNQAATWVLVQERIPRAPTEDECTDAAARFTKPGLKVEYAAMPYSNGGTETFSDCFIPYGNWKRP